MFKLAFRPFWVECWLEKSVNLIERGGNMAFLSGILAFFMSFLSIFGGIFGGFSGGGEGGGSNGIFFSEAQASEAYQNGSWDGSKTGIYYVQDGLLYAGDKISNYPADSSRNYYRPVIVSKPGEFTVFEYSPGPGSSLYSLHWDYRGKELHKVDLSNWLKYSTEHKTCLSDDGTEILVRSVFKSGEIETLHIPVYDFET